MNIQQNTVLNLWENDEADNIHYVQLSDGVL